MAVHAALVFVVAVGCAEYGGAYGAGKVLDVVLAVERRDVGAAEGLPALEAEQIEPPEVVSLAQGVLSGRLFWHGEELGSDNFATVLRGVSRVGG